MGVADVTLHDSSCGKGNRPSARHVKKESTGKITAVMVTVITRPAGTRKWWACHVVGTRGAIFSVIQSVRSVSTSGWQKSPRVSFGARVPNVFARSTGGVRGQIDLHGSADEFCGVEVRSKRAGCTITRTRLSNEREIGWCRWGPSKSSVIARNASPAAKGGAADRAVRKFSQGRLQ